MAGGASRSTGMTTGTTGAATTGAMATGAMATGATTTKTDCVSCQQVNPSACDRPYQPGLLCWLLNHDVCPQNTTTSSTGGPICDTQTFTKVEDRPVVKEVKTYVKEHHPVEKQVSMNIPCLSVSCNNVSPNKLVLYHIQYSQGL